MKETQTSPEVETAGSVPADAGGEESGCRPGPLLPALVVKTATEPVTPTYEGDFVLNEPLVLECGRTLTGVTLHYALYGRLSARKENAVLVCHALSGSALVAQWWPELFAPGGIVDLSREFVVCVNLLGSCYGSTGPSSVDPETGRIYGPEFPLVSIRDNVRAQARLLDSLGIPRLSHVLGGSIGGMQALEWAVEYPQRVEKATVIGVAPLGAMGLALNHLQRRAIQNDPEWQEGKYLTHRQPRNGLSLARQIAMISYKSPELFAERFGRRPNRNGEEPEQLDRDGGGLIGGRFDVAGYLDHQGERFLERFDANSYLAILRTMDTWDPGRGYGSAAEAFRRIQGLVKFIGISSDLLFPAQDVERLAGAVAASGARAVYREMVSLHGHDAFLAEQAELISLLNSLE